MRNCGAQQVLEEVAKMEQKLARIGVFIVLVFVICQIGPGLLNILSLIDGGKNAIEIFVNVDRVDYVSYSRLVAEVLTVSNSSVNFFIYFCHSGNIKKKIKSSFSCWKREPCRTLA